MNNLKFDLAALKRKMTGYSRETLDRSVRRLERFDRLGLDLYNLDVEWIYSYCEREREHGKLAKSLRVEMNDLALWASFTNQKIDLPKFKKEPSPDPKFPSDEEYQGLLLACRRKRQEKIRDYLKQEEHENKWYRIELILKVLGDGGMRVSELVRINIEDFSDKGVFIRSSKREKNRFVALSPQTLSMVKEYITSWRKPSDPKAFLTGDYGRITRAVVRQYVKESGKVSGLGYLHPHAMRHYCATRLLRAGIDIRKIQVHMGHKDISSTQEYTHLLTQDVQVEIYNLYAGEREPRFFPEIEEAVICAV